jgi:hypothetical protein
MVMKSSTNASWAHLSLLDLKQGFSHKDGNVEHFLPPVRLGE